MTTQYTPILKLALPVTGELSGTWGDVVNDNITSMVEQAIAGLATISTWSANAHTLSTANGTTSESRCAMLVAQDGAGLAAAGEIICPASSKLYVLKNATSYQLTLKTSGGSGIAVASGDTAFLFCDGTNVNSCVTTIVNGHITGNLTVDGNATINGNTTLGNATSDTVTVTARVASSVLPSADNTYDLGSTANSWKDLYIDGTATMALVAISGGTINNVSIGATTPATFLAVDNLSLDGNTIASTNTNGNITIAPNGTGDVYLDADTVRVGDSGAAATLTSNGAGALTVTTGGAADLTLSTNSGTTSGTITIANGANGNITLTPNGTGDVILSADTTQIGDANTDAYLTTNGTGNLNLTTNNGTNSGTIQIAQGANGNITLTPNGTGSVSISKAYVSGNTTLGATSANTLSVAATITSNLIFTDNTYDIGASGATRPRNLYLAGDATIGGSIAATTLDLTNLEVTNIKAKDGTASITLADSTGVASFTANPILSGGTANGVAYLNGSKVLTTGSALTFDGQNLGVDAASVYGASYITLSLRSRFGFDGNNVVVSDAGTGKDITFLTNGSERMRVTNTGLGIGTSSPSGKLSVVGRSYFQPSTGTAVITLLNTSGGDGSIQVSGTSNTMNYGFSTYSTSNALYIQNDGNVGIGTTSPNKLLTLYSATNDVEVLRINANGGAGGVQAKADIGFGYYDGVTEANAAIGFEEYGTASAGGSLLFKTRPDGASASTRPTERMRISNAGKVGIGTNAPDLTLDVYGDNGSNGDAYRIMVLQTNNAAAAGMGGGIAFGGYYGASRLNDFAGIQGFKENSTIGDYAGALRFTTRASGGSPTERVRISSAGYVGILTTSPSAPLTVNGNCYVAGISGGTGSKIYFDTTGSGADNWIGTVSDYANRIYCGRGSSSYFSAAPYTLEFGVNGSERMRIDSSGNVGIGTATISYRLNIVAAGNTTPTRIQLSDTDGREIAMSNPTSTYDAWIGTPTNHNMNLRVGNSGGSSLYMGFQLYDVERMRIDSSGRLLVGCTAFPSSTVPGTAIFMNGPNGGSITIANNQTGGFQYVMNFINGNGSVGRIDTSSSSTSYVTTSDARTKEDLGVATSTNVIKDTVVHDFIWKSTGEKARGIFAQEAYLVNPSAVSKGKSDELDGKGNPKHPWGVDYSKYVPDIIVELQSLRAEFDAYKASHP